MFHWPWRAPAGSDQLSMYVFEPVSSCSCRIVKPATPTNFLLLDSLRHTLPNQEKKTKKNLICCPVVHDFRHNAKWVENRIRRQTEGFWLLTLNWHQQSLTPASHSHLTNLTRTESWVSKRHGRKSSSGARFSKVPRTFRARKAIRKTTTYLFCKAGLLICCKGNKNKNNCKVSCLETHSLWRYKENYVTRSTPEKFRDFRETSPRPSAWQGQQPLNWGVIFTTY